MAVTTAANARPQQPYSVTNALKTARESADNCMDPVTTAILEFVLTRVWHKVLLSLGSYVMTREEFAVFNFFQYRYIGNEIAVNARKLYWDNTHA
ncbi:hypothetical protein FHETE_1372 [Fusarium heterosporum]|uniref:Uncharacterized protein n=1 Tax=Fusarium heterosporum TaxID=42747 RepID=A0A8H5U1I8_FUSHE|nr:hypothetical protein FHETE_1372 [Fusarium heterosporum]